MLTHLMHDDDAGPACMTVAGGRTSSQPTEVDCTACHQAAGTDPDAC